ncbi:hypothetical protein [Flavobacterium gilvum]|uniref:Uncharacterized protein n=1 Tax=Flavobacterium gilvum TaxID=1492737 RepID=A0AAC9I3Y2_9FLAO|nr:hypothetical protein [Flavobacterium gilvum]AOW09904.1 hypothetical protein EM308_10505 [Flavobacterium gilvum]
MNIKLTVEDLINYLNSGFEIIMESDLVSLLFHCFLTNNSEVINKIHSETRVLNSDGLHIDLVIGEITLESKRPSVIPELLIECKIFGNGFTNSQLSKRFTYLKEDISKLNEIRHEVPKYLIVYDYCDYLNDLRRTELLQLKNNINKDISIFLIYKKDKFNYKIL